MKSETYICLIRGINVGGQKIVKMERLRESLTRLGLGGVKTYVQSGNVVFKAPGQSEEGLCGKIRKKIQSDFGFDVSVILRTAEEMGKTIEKNPFLKEKGIDTSKLHVTFLEKLPEKANLKSLETLKIEPDALRHLGTEIYLYYPNGFSGAKLSHNTLERLLGCKGTSRNWNTVNQLHRMASSV
jgi:uncharacterized protein (DUF1697 family)